MSRWFKKMRYNSESCVRLFVFPYAGGGPSAFREWQKEVAEFADVFVMHAPGREGRFQEAPIGCLRSLVSILLNEIEPYLDVPFVFVGHSNGAVTAFELARQMARLGMAGNLKHLVLSARRSPHLGAVRTASTEFSRNEFIQSLRESSAVPQVILNDPDLIEVFLPMLRADFGLGADYDFSAVNGVDCGVSLFWGAKDKDVTSADVLAWRYYFGSRVRTKEFESDHFFIHHERKAYIAELNVILRMERKTSAGSYVRKVL